MSLEVQAQKDFDKAKISHFLFLMGKEVEALTEKTNYIALSIRPFNRLTPEINIHIFSSLNIQELCKISLVCKEWNKLAKDYTLWKQHLEKVNPCYLYYFSQLPCQTTVDWFFYTKMATKCQDIDSALNRYKRKLEVVNVVQDNMQAIYSVAFLAINALSLIRFFTA